MENKNLILQQLLSKILVKKIIDNFHNILADKNISHAELSRKAGKNEGAFNKTFNEAEDLKLSSFLRYWHAFKSLEEEKYSSSEDNAVKFEDLLDSEAHRMLNLISQLKNYDLNFISIEDIKLLQSLKYYFKQLKNKNILTEREIAVYEKILESRKEGESNEL
ncbi:MAG: hypothetical protein H0Z24_09445 [Thermosipho sp. (in: Bacteria)]|nr:hypothetical protein [Thermosipho sp. (in: thermotogales)]